MENKDEYKFDHIEEVIEQVGTPQDVMDIEYDDSFMDNNDRKKLIECIITEVKRSPNYAWADEVMINCLVMYKYKQVINKMDIEAYKREKEELEKDPLLILKS
jgi:menaquinone-dependent protoporphyrinogen IX oxidase